MQKRINKRNEGFTIVEVLIVLAIAGLIIAIVLFAVPALQRQGRNTGITTDANAIAGYLGDYEQANNGAIPTKAGSDFTTAGVVKFQAGTAGAKTGVLTSGRVQGGTTVTAQDGAAAISLTAADIGSVKVAFGAACPDTPAAAMALTANSRSNAVVYVTEAGSGIVPRCVSA